MMRPRKFSLFQQWLPLLAMNMGFLFALNLDGGLLFWMGVVAVVCYLVLAIFGTLDWLSISSEDKCIGVVEREERYDGIIAVRHIELGVNEYGERGVVRDREWSFGEWVSYQSEPTSVSRFDWDVE